MAVTYEVNLDVSAEIAGEFIVWLHDHVQRIRALPGFTRAQMFDVTDPAAPEDRVHLCVQYRMIDGDALDAYVRDYAAQMRAEGSERFGRGFTASRRVLRAVAEY